MPLNIDRRDFLRRASTTTLVTSTLAQMALAASTGPAKRRIKVGQIGVGHSHAEGKLEVLRASSDWELVGVAEPDDQLRQDARQRQVYQDVEWMSPKQLLDTPGLEVVLVETTVDGLLAAAEQCIAAGKHIHLDKPPGDDLERFRRLLSSADEKKLAVQMGYMYRYNPGVVLLRELLAKGWLGEIFELNAVMSKQVGDSKRLRWAQYAGGTMFELGCHLIDLVVGLLGKPDSVTPFNLHSLNNNDGLLDNMLAVCSYPRATATVRSTALEVEGGERRHLTVCGTKGTVHIQPLDKRPVMQLALDEAHGPYVEGYQTIELGSYDRYVDDLADLAAIVRGEKLTDFDSTHDLAAQETLLMACGIVS